MNVTLGTFKSTPKIQNAVQDVLESGRISYGPVSRLFEQEFAKMHRCKYGVSSNSGTSSLVVAIQAMKEIYGWKDGDEIIAPALTFVATINAILQNRLVPILVDVDPRSYNINVDLIEDAITSRTRAILPVHLFGLMADMWGICDIAKRHNLKVIEDSCETILASNLGKMPGEMGDIACFSTYVAHHLVTGVGGMAITNNPYLAMKMRSLTNHGIDLSEIPKGAEYETMFLSRKFRFTSIGHSFRVTEIESAIGLAQLPSLEKAIETRRKNAVYLTAQLSHLRDHIQLHQAEVGEMHSWMVYPIVLRDSSKWPIMPFLNQNGIECREMLPLTNQPCYKGLWNPLGYPVAENINQRGIYVGIHQELTKNHLDYVNLILTTYFNQEGEFDSMLEEMQYQWTTCS